MATPAKLHYLTVEDLVSFAKCDNGYGLK